MNNGLEALAALASASPAHGSSQCGEENGSRSSHEAVTVSTDDTRSASASSGHGQQPVLPKESLTVQQLEQMLAAASAQQTSSSNNVHYGLTAQNLALLGSLQAQQQRSAHQAQQDNSAVLAMKQLAYYQYMAQAKNLQQQIPQYPPNAASSALGVAANPGLFDAAKAASLANALGGNHMTGVQQRHGKSLDSHSLNSLISSPCWGAGPLHHGGEKTSVREQLLKPARWYDSVLFTAQ
jgi:hypothetical protein